MNRHGKPVAGVEAGGESGTRARVGAGQGRGRVAGPIFLVMPLVALMSVVNAAGQDPGCLVGVYYFSGWWKDQPNKYQTGGRAWLEDFPGRRALLGEFNDAPTMDREIRAAADAGVDFFQILYYPVTGRFPPESHADRLNEGLRLFRASPEKKCLRFTVEYVNHPPFDLPGDPEWEAACREWASVMKDPSYLRVGDRPVFKIHGLQHFLNQNGGDRARAAARVGTLRRIARESGAGDPLVSAGVSPLGIPPESDMAPYDFVTTYMEVTSLPAQKDPYPYAQLLETAETGWKSYGEKCPRPYVPYVPAGWDPRPWKDPRPSFVFPTPDEWKYALRRAGAALDRYPNLGVPLPDGGRQKMLLIYAWNEFAEGGIVAPTAGEGDTKLRGIREVFGAK